MLYAVELYFDKETEEKIMRLLNGIAKKGISKRYLEWQTRPHAIAYFFNFIPSFGPISLVSGAIL